MQVASLSPKFIYFLLSNSLEYIFTGKRWSQGSAFWQIQGCPKTSCKRKHQAPRIQTPHWTKSSQTCHVQLFCGNQDIYEWATEEANREDTKDHWGRRGSYDEEGDGSKSSIDALLRQAFLSPKIEQAIDSSQRTKFPHGEQQVLELHPWGRTLLLLRTCSSPWPCLEAC